MPDLLFLCHRVPYPPNKGEKIRAWHILTHLAGTHRVHLGCLADDPADLAHGEALRRVCARIGCFAVRPRVQKLRAMAKFRPGRPLTLDYFHSPALSRWIADTLAHHPIERLYVYSSGMAGYAAARQAAIRVLDLVDVDSEKWRAYAPRHGWPMRAIYRREADTLFAFERRAAMAFDRTLFVSEAEARHFAALAPECGARVDWLENGVDLERFSPARSYSCPYPQDAQNLVFTGAMDYWPNVDAVLWFAKQVMPLLRRERPQLRFHIVGANPASGLLRLRGAPGIEVTGRVADIRPYLAHAAVAVAPLRIARGIQNKVLEAMAMARPVVATPAAFEGVRAVPGRDLLVCAEAEETARRIAEILDGRHPTLPAAARRAVERNHDWSSTLQRLDALFPAAARPLASLAAARSEA
ncbi:MAG TPA: TIGR03087 family PEP-CTERM/XrtA system glycosyltransferase [Stellaceae bacterium]|nr:TIGR03087 family PEP-CTERM/XrtA system glycosyltransferase [Stellaceae bacterium]